MLQNLRDRASDERGFTLIELLVVILIIGILAAIALPTFLGQKNKAKDSGTKSDVRNAVSHVESCLVDAAAVADCAGTNAKAGISGMAAGVTSTVVSAEEYSVTKTDTTQTPNKTFSVCKSTAGYGRGFATCTVGTFAW